MNRRQFTSRLKEAAFLSVLSSSFAFSTAYRGPKKIKAKRLKKGDTVGIISPGSSIGDEELESAVSNIERMGFKVKLSKNARAKRGFNAGTDEQRLNDLHSMFADKQVDAVWCSRGGYGCSRLLPFIDYNLIKRNPKILIGYSDVTALIQAIHVKTGLITFHGPVGSSEVTEYNKQQIFSTLVDPKPNYSIPLAQDNLQNEQSNYKIEVLRPGKMTGTLTGGNLSLMAALAGTDYAMDAKGKLVFIEDIGEKPYRIDRMLTQLRQTINLDKAAGIALGIFVDCEAKPEASSLSLNETLRDRLASLNIPVIYGLSFGHILNQCTLPVGIKASLDTAEQSINLLEAAVK